MDVPNLLNSEDTVEMVRLVPQEQSSELIFWTDRGPSHSTGSQAAS